MKNNKTTTSKTGNRRNSFSPEYSGHLGVPGGGVCLEFEDEEVCGGHVPVCLHLGQLQLPKFRVLVHYEQDTASVEEGKGWLIESSGDILGKS